MEFRLDTALGKALVVEKQTPYDFAGGAPDGSAKPLDTTELPDGRHAVLAGVTLQDGVEVGVYSTFTVANGHPTTPPPTTPTTPPTSSTPKPTVTPPTTPKPTTPSTPTSTPTAPPGGGCPGYPNPACTGVPAGTSLTTIQGDLKVTKANEVVDGKRITGRLIIAANGVTVRNSEIYHGITGDPGGHTYPYKVSDTTVGPPSGCDGGVAVGMSEYTATRVHIHNFGDGFRDSGDNILIEESFIKLCSNPGDHSDGVQGYKGGKNVVVRHTTIDQREAQSVTSPVFFADESAGAKLENNLLAGGGYTVRLYGTGYTFKGNKVVQGSWNFGPVASDCGGIDWADNQLVTIDSSYQLKSTVGTLSC